jgi:hypothetical protein
VQQAFLHIAKFATFYIEALTEFHAIEVKDSTMVRDNTKHSAQSEQSKNSKKKRGHSSSSSNTQSSEPKRSKPSTDSNTTPAFKSYDEWKSMMLMKCKLSRDKSKSCFGCGRDVSNNQPQHPHNQKNCRASKHSCYNTQNVPFHESKKGKQWIQKHGEIHLCKEFKGKLNLSDPSVQLQIAYELGLDYIIIDKQIVDWHLPYDICVPCLAPYEHQPNSQQCIIPVPYHRSQSKQLTISQNQSLPIFVAIPDCSRLGPEEPTRTPYTMVPSAIVDTGCLGRNYMSHNLYKHLNNSSVNINKCTCKIHKDDVVCSPLAGCAKPIACTTLIVELFNEVNKRIERVKLDFLVIDQSIDLIIGQNSINKYNLSTVMHNYIRKQTVDGKHYNPSTQTVDAKYVEGVHHDSILKLINPLTKAASTYRQTKRESINALHVPRQNQHPSDEGYVRTEKSTFLDYESDDDDIVYHEPPWELVDTHDSKETQADENELPGNDAHHGSSDLQTESKNIVNRHANVFSVC